MTSFSDTLDSTDQPLNDFEMVHLYILASLPSEFDFMVTSITILIDPMSFEKFYGHLLTRESRIDTHTVDIGVSVANLAAINSSNCNQGSHQSANTNSGNKENMVRSRFYWDLVHHHIHSDIIPMIALGEHWRIMLNK
jgi:hypothetical protein